MTDDAQDQSVLAQKGAKLVPGWLENLAALAWRVLAIVAFLIALAYLGSLIWNVVAAIGLAIVVAVILAPWIMRLREGGRSPAGAAGIAWITTIGVGLGLLVLLALALLPYLIELIDRVGEGQDQIEAAIADLQLPAWLSTLLIDVITNAESIGSDAVSRIVTKVADLAGIVILGAFLLFFFLKDGDKGWLWMFGALDEEKRERINTAGTDALDRVGNYVRGTTAMASIAAVTSFLFMLLLGTPLALPLALLTFITAYIPYFGGAIAAVLIVVITWGAVSDTAALVMTALLLLRFAIVTSTVRHRAYERALTIPPAVIIVVLPIGVQLGGLVGLILVVPLTAVVLSVAQVITDVLRPDQPKALPSMVPAWLDRAAQWSWRAVVVLLLVAMLVAVLTTFPLVVLPVIIALIAASTITPLFEAIVRRGQSRTVAAAAAVGGSAAVIASVLAFTITALVTEAQEIGDTAVSGAEEVDEAAAGLLGIGTEAVEAGAEFGVQAAQGISDGLAALLVVTILGVLLSFYFLRDGAKLWGGLMSHFPSDAAGELSAAGARAFSVLGGYMIGTGAISLVGAGSQALIMWVLGLPLVMPIFVLSFFGGFIPYIGSLLTTLLAFMVAWAVGDTIDIIVMGIWTVVFNLVQGNVVAPMVYNRTVHIHPAIALAAIPAGSAIAGILGMFIVVPALGVVTVTWRPLLKLMGSSDDELPGLPPTEAPDEAGGGGGGDAGEDAAAADPDEAAPEPA